MSPPHSHSEDAQSPSDLGEQCMLYLLGELDADAAGQFVNSLETSPAVRDELERQADLLALLPNAFETKGQLAVPLQLDASPTIARWSMSASALAVAGCIAVVMLGLQWSTPSADQTAASEDLLIARAWADNQLGVTATDLSEPELDRVIDIDPGESTGDDEDSTLDWMFIAVSANLDSLPAGATSDG